MTIEAFKIKYPQYKDLKGEELWNMMERMFLIEKAKQKKSYHLRWLFYRKPQAWKLSTNDYTASKVCDSCKKGVSTYMNIMDFGNQTCISICPHCRNQEMKPIDNTNFNHKLWQFGKKIDKQLENFLNFTHLLRKKGETRYGFFGDESRYILSTEFSKDWEFIKDNFRTRKWWEHLIIEKK